MQLFIAWKVISRAGNCIKIDRSVILNAKAFAFKSIEMWLIMQLNMQKL